MHRGERDFYALWIANSWLGEHRNQASHLFQVIREQRGLNYGDYSYIEAFPEGGEPHDAARQRAAPRAAVRDLDPHAAERARPLFALRAALRELQTLVDHGLTEEQFELTRGFLKKYSLHFAETTSARLGYAVDDRFYGIDGEGHLARFRKMMDELTLDDVNAAIKRHLQTANLKIAIVTGDAPGLAAVLTGGAPTPITYDNPKPPEIIAEDREIAAFPLGIAVDRMTIVPVEERSSADAARRQDVAEFPTSPAGSVRDPSETARADTRGARYSQVCMIVGAMGAVAEDAEAVDRRCAGLGRQRDVPRRA